MKKISVCVVCVATMALVNKGEGAGQYCPVGGEGAQSTVFGNSAVGGRMREADDFARVSKLTGGNFSLDVEIPRVVGTIGGKQFSVGGGRLHTHRSSSRCGNQGRRGRSVGVRQATCPGVEKSVW